MAAAGSGSGATPKTRALLGLGLAESRPAAVQTRFYGSVLAPLGIDPLDFIQFPLARLPFRFLHVGHGVNQEQGRGHFGMVQGKLQRDGASGG